MNEAKIYEIKITAPKDGVGGAVATTETEAVAKKKAPDTKSNVELMGGVAKGTIAGIATVYATSQLVIRPIVRGETDRYMINGDMVQAAAIQRTYNNVNQYIGLGLEAASIAAGFMVNPVLGGVALMGSVVKHTTAAINRAQDNAALAGINRIDNFVNSYERARMIDVKVGD